MRFKLFGTEIYISFLFAAVITLMILFDRTGMAVPTISAVILHETAHLFVMWALECAPKKVKLIPASVQITASFTRQYKNDIIIAVCGPLANFVLFLTLYLNYLAYKNDTSLYYALINLLIGSFNSLPVWGLDGGTVLYCILTKRFSPRTAETTVKLITLISAVSVIIAAIILTLKAKLNITLYIIGIYLIVMCIIKN